MKIPDLNSEFSTLISRLGVDLSGLTTYLKNDKRFALLSAEKRNSLLQNVEDIKDILFHSRYPKFAILGNSKRERSDILGLFLNPAEFKRETMLGRNWFELGSIRVADLREETTPEKNTKDLAFLDRDIPDIILSIIDPKIGEQELETLLLHTLHLKEEIEDRMEICESLNIIYIVDEKSDSKVYYDIRKRISTHFKNIGIEKTERGMVFSISRIRKISEACIDALPARTRLPLVRLTTNEKAKSKFLDSIIQLSIAANSTIAGVPLPIADMIPITSIQTLMILTIAYAKGKTLNAKMFAAFLASLGLNVGVGFAMREVVRALSQLVPLAGPFVSASIAGSTTATLGKQAVKYFSQHESAEEKYETD